MPTTFRSFDTDRLTVREFRTEDESVWQRILGAYSSAPFPPLFPAEDTALPARPWTLGSPTNAQPQVQYSAIVRSNDREILGVLSCKGSDKSRVEIGYWIEKKFRCQGYASEAIRGLSDELLRPGSGSTVVVAHVHRDNRPSRRVLEKNHFQFRGLLWIFPREGGQGLPTLRWEKGAV